MEETNVSPGADTQIPAPELAVTPEVAAPENVATQPEQPQEEDPHAKSIRSMERRIQRLTAARYEAQARAEQAQREANELKAKFQEPAQQQPQQVDPVALAREIAAVERITDKANTIAKEGEKRFAGEFAQSLRAVTVEAGPLFEPNGKPTSLGEAVLEADDPAALLHHLGKNPDLAAELEGLSPVQVARKVARIEAQMQAPKEPKQSTAPKPIAPVKGKREEGGLSDDLPTEEWIKRFNQRRRG